MKNTLLQEFFILDMITYTDCLPPLNLIDFYKKNGYSRSTIYYFKSKNRRFKRAHENMCRAAEEFLQDEINIRGLMTTRDVAAYLCMTRRSVLETVRLGRLRCFSTVRFKRNYKLFKFSDVQAYKLRKNNEITKKQYDRKKNIAISC